MTVHEFCRAIDAHPGEKMHWMLPDKSFCTLPTSVMW